MSPSRFVAGLLTIISVFVFAPAVDAYTPKSKEVRDMVAKGVAYLESTDSSDLGRDCLVALALFKAEKLGSPKIAAALNRAAAECTGEKLEVLQQVHRTYDHACALILLCEVNSPAHRPVLDRLAKTLISWQKQNGAWGYEHESIGDTSQTVFALLALWEARKKQANVPNHVFSNACKWLIRTQDSGGGYAYKGNDPEDANGNRIRQTNPYPCATAAGLGATYICANALGLNAAIGRHNTAADAILPGLEFVGVIDADGKVATESTSDVNGAFLLRALTDGTRFFDRGFSIDPANWFYAPEPWNYYYLYTLERFRSFQELAEKVKIDENDEPTWYNEGVNYLMRKQNAKTGVFGGAEAANSRLAGPQVATSLAVLFLVRSTQNTIKQVEDQLKCQRGFDSATDELTISSDNRINTTRITQSVGDLISILDSTPSDEELLKKLSNINFELEGDATTRREQTAKMHGLVTHKIYAVRRKAVEQLGKVRDLDNVPPLIYALSDPDPKVWYLAHNGLKFISRKFEGFGLRFETTPDKKQMDEVTQKWKQWYLSMRPGGAVDLYE